MLKNNTDIIILIIYETLKLNILFTITLNIFDPSSGIIGSKLNRKIAKL